MKIVLCFAFLYGLKSSFPVNEDNQNRKKMERITEKSILKKLDSSIEGDYNNFIDLGHGYFELANCRLTLFKDNNEWAVVFEKFGYNARAGQPVQMEVSFFGNCLKDLSEYNGQSANVDFIDIDNNIYDILLKKEDTITIRNQKIKIPLDIEPYQKYGINWEYNGENYMGAVLKYLAETNPELTRATESELRRCLPNNLKKIMIINSWYQEEYHQFAPTVPPSQQETFQMIAKVLVSGNIKYYKPTKSSNTHWSNWLESGGL